MSNYKPLSETEYQALLIRAWKEKERERIEAPIRIKKLLDECKKHERETRKADEPTCYGI